MKITDKRNNITAHFGGISVGRVFKGASNNIFYIKTSSIIDTDGDTICNAINLCNGLPHMFDNDTPIIPVAAELIIT